MVVNTGDNRWATSNFIVAPTLAEGASYTTIAAALTAASSGNTIFIKPGTYTENLSLKPGVNLTAFDCDSSLNGTGNVIISGTCTLTSAGSVTISGIQLQTNSAALLAVTGSAASVVMLKHCYLNCSNNTGITFSSSSSSAAIYIDNCSGNLGTTGIAYFAHSSAGNMFIRFSEFFNSGASTTNNTVSSGILFMKFCNFPSPITSSSTGGLELDSVIMNLSALNTTAVTHGGSNTGARTIQFSQIGGGTASAISIGNTMNVIQSDINSSNTNAITGAGTILYQNLTFTGTSKTINTTTQTISGIGFGSTNTAPTAGMIGENLVNSASGVSVSPSNTTINITSVSLTAGVWDVSALATGVPSAAGLTTVKIQITSSSATFSGTVGIDIFQSNFATGQGLISATIPPLRVVVNTTTTYYLVGTCVFGSGTMTMNGRISATRVG